jgi:hypothetical protein
MYNVENFEAEVFLTKIRSQSPGANASDSTEPLDRTELNPTEPDVYL